MENGQIRYFKVRVFRDNTVIIKRKYNNKNVLVFLLFIRLK